MSLAAHQAFFGRSGLTVQNARLLDHAREVRDSLFVDDRRLRLLMAPDLRQVAAGQNRDEVPPI
jgi:hypothetical protein